MSVQPMCMSSGRLVSMQLMSVRPMGTWPMSMWPMGLLFSVSSGCGGSGRIVSAAGVVAAAMCMVPAVGVMAATVCILS